MPSTFQPQDISRLATTLPVLFNTLNVRRAIIPAANGHCSARALARYYAALVDGGMVPPLHSSSSKPPLGSHPHIPKLSPLKPVKKRKGRNKELITTSNPTKQMQNSDGSDDGGYSKKTGGDYIRVANDGSSSMNIPTTTGMSVDTVDHHNVNKIFSNPRIHDAFLGAGDYENLVLPSGKFGLGFRRYYTKDGSLIGFGHSGMGGSMGYCDIKNRVAIAVTLNKMSFGAVTGNIVHLVCSELGLPVPDEFSRFGEREPDMQHNIEKPLIN